jgi:hypothetical protein
MTRRQLVLVVPALLTVHNLEEALTFQRWLPVIEARVPITLQPWIQEISPESLQGALLVVTLVPWALALWCARRPSNAVAIWFILLIQTVVALNACWHVLVAGIILRGYSPGLVTAVALNVPFSMALLRRATRERWCSPRALMALLPAALFVHGPLLTVLLYLAGRVT